MRVGVSRAIRVACLGALAFWGPDILVHAIRRHLFDRPEVLVLTITMPLTLLLCWVIVGKYLGISAKSAAVRMLLGIWLLGGLCMTIGASFSGGGFAGPDGVRGAAIVLGMSLVPIYTFIMATYDGSLGALLLVTAILLTVWLFPFSRLKATRLKQLYR